MKVSFLILLLVANYSYSNAQDLSIDSLNYYLENTGNSSVIITHNYVEELGLDGDAFKICRNTSEHTVKRLIENLGYKNKALLSHVILSKNFEINTPRLKYVYNYLNSKIISTTYTYNNFSWSQLNDGTIEIEDSEIRKIKEYWRSKRTQNMIILRKCSPM